MRRAWRLHLALALATAGCFEINPPAACTSSAECGEGAYCADGACVEGTGPEPDGARPTTDGSTGGTPVPTADARPVPVGDAQVVPGVDATPAPDAAGPLNDAGPPPPADALIIADALHAADAAGPAADAVPPGVDVAVPVADAYVPDAFVPGLDAFVPGPDAFVPGPDAFVHGPGELGPIFVAEDFLRVDVPATVSIALPVGAEDAQVEWTTEPEGAAVFITPDPLEPGVAIVTPLTTGHVTLVASVPDDASLTPSRLEVLVFDCIDQDEDGRYTAAPAADVPDEATARGICNTPGFFDCNDVDRAYGEGFDEACDDVDTDCDGDPNPVDPQDVEHCGDCNTNCARDHAVVTCENSQCVDHGCEVEWSDANGDPLDGCETACIDRGDELTCNGFDDDCDGEIDGGLCAPFMDGFCTNRRAVGLFDDLCEDFHVPLTRPWRAVTHDAAAVSRPHTFDRHLGSNVEPVTGTSRPIAPMSTEFSVQFSVQKPDGAEFSVALTQDDAPTSLGQRIGYELRGEADGTVILEGHGYFGNEQDEAVHIAAYDGAVLQGGDPTASSGGATATAPSRCASTACCGCRFRSARTPWSTTVA
jgi:hypothetical protein